MERSRRGGAATVRPFGRRIAGSSPVIRAAGQCFFLVGFGLRVLTYS